MHASSSFTLYLRDKYAHLLDNLKVWYENVQTLCANNESYNHQTITDESDLTESMTGLNRDFASSTKQPWTGKGTIWATTRLKMETYFEYAMINILFDLGQGKSDHQRK